MPFEIHACFLWNAYREPAAGNGQTKFRNHTSSTLLFPLLESTLNYMKGSKIAGLFHLFYLNMLRIIINTLTCC